MVTRSYYVPSVLQLGDNIPIPELPSLEERGNEDNAGDENVMSKVDGERGANIAQGNIEERDGGGEEEKGESITQDSTGNRGGDEKKAEKKDPPKEDKIDINLVSKVRSTP